MAQVAPYFDIKEDLEFRDLETQVEILLISGPTCGQPVLVAAILGVPKHVLDSILYNEST
jgi:hypothetical protein